MFLCTWRFHYPKNTIIVPKSRSVKKIFWSQKKNTPGKDKQKTENIKESTNDQELGKGMVAQNNQKVGRNQQ